MAFCSWYQGWSQKQPSHSWWNVRNHFPGHRGDEKIPSHQPWALSKHRYFRALSAWSAHQVWPYCIFGQPCWHCVLIRCKQRAVNEVVKQLTHSYPMIIALAYKLHLYFHHSATVVQHWRQQLQPLDCLTCLFNGTMLAGIDEDTRYLYNIYVNK